MAGRRLTQRLGSWLALLALTVQFVLSFGHIHPEDIFPPGGRGPGAAPVVLHSQPDPHRQGAQHAGDDVCSICLTLYMLASATTPPPIEVAPLFSYAREVPQPRIAAIAGPTRHLLFQSRAPPTL